MKTHARLLALSILAPLLVFGACAGKTRCKSAGDPMIAEAQADVARKNEEAFQAARKRAGLEPVSLGTTQRTISEGLAEHVAPIGASPEKDGSVVTIGADRFLAGPTWWTLDGREHAVREFAIDAKGVLHPITRVPRDAGVVRFQVCGCQPPPCGPYGSGCPACGQTVQELYGPLPKDVTVGPSIPISFDRMRVQLDYTQGACQDPCPPPPPSMAR